MVAILRRTVMAALSTLLWFDPLGRSQAFAMTCLVVLLLHTLNQPFRNSADNAVESGSLFMLAGH